MSATAWSAYDVRVDLLEPVVMTSGDRSRNRMSTLDYLTGSSLRGALALRWLRARGPERAPGHRPSPIPPGPDRDRFFEIFESGAVRFPFLHRAGARVPPLSLHGCKANASHPRVDFAALFDRSSGRVTCAECSGVLDRIRSLDDGRSTVTRVVTRTAIDDREVAARSMLYAQEELVEDITFHGTLMARSDLDDILPNWLPIARPARVRLGAGRSTLGLVRVHIRRTDTPDASGQPVGERAQRWRDKTSAADTVVMTALSPLVLTDAFLRPVSRFDPDVARDVLGIDATPVEHTTSRVTSIAGWNPAAGLPKPVDVAMVPGTVLTAKLPTIVDKVTLARFDRIEREGIGWRRAEGFGQVRFWDPIHLDPGVSL